MLKRILIGLGLASLFVTSLVAAGKPNVVIVLADDVSWSSFGCSGAGLLTRTPNIDTLASQGVRFQNFSVAAATCAPARHELYTGLLPPTSGVYGNGYKPKAGFQNMVNYMGDLGYNVGLTGKTHFHGPTEFPMIPGFTGNANDKAPSWELSGVKAFIEASQAEQAPFCVVIASVDAHHPWTTGDASNFPLDQIVVPPHMVDTPVTREALAIHAAEVEELDRQVGATMQMLDEMKLTKDTVLIFLSEQGTALPQGKYSIYDFGTRALCVVSWPGKFKPAVTDAVGMYCDIVPTIVDIAGGPAPSVDGKSLLPVLKGKTSEHRRNAFLVHQMFGFSQRAIRTKDYKLIWTPEQENSYYVDVIMNPKSSKFFGGVWREWLEFAQTDSNAQATIDRVLKRPEFELYDIQKDPWELENLAENPEYAQVLAEMQAQIKADMERMGDTFSFTDPKQEKLEKKQSGESKKKKKKKK